jgi:hypothetical protein
MQNRQLDSVTFYFLLCKIIFVWFCLPIKVMLRYIQISARLFMVSVSRLMSKQFMKFGLETDSKGKKKVEKKNSGYMRLE